MVRRTKDEAEKTRSAILDAAGKIFFTHGVSCSSLEQIAEQAGVTRGAVYWHFKDKEALCTAMAGRVFLLPEEMLEDLAGEMPDKPLSNLRKVCVRLLELMSIDKKLRNVLSILTMRYGHAPEMVDVKKQYSKSRNRMLALTEKYFAQADAMKMLAPCWTPRKAALALESLMVGLVVTGQERRKGVGFSSTGVACVEAFFDSLQTQRGA